MDHVSYLFARGPRNDAEEAILDDHIEMASKQIRDAWTDEERELRAMRAGSPLREPAKVPTCEIDIDKLPSVDKDG